ncbi:MAG: YceI family protein [Spirosomataceae bacterium]
MKKYLILSLMALPMVVMAQKKRLSAEAKSSEIRYAMVHPMHSWEAVSKSFQCVIVWDESKQLIEAVAVAVPVKTFDSQNSNRDSHALEVLEALKYPNVTFSSSQVSGQDQNWKVKGKLTFHGVTREIEFPITLKQTATSLEVTGGFTVLMQDYQIENPTLLGIKTKEDIRLQFKVLAKK